MFSRSPIAAGLPLLVGALLLGTIEGGAQALDPPAFTIYGTEDGLSQAGVNALLQDARGFIWIGTQQGLNRFDGTGFKAFHHLRGDSTSLSDGHILSLARGAEGVIWVGTDRGGLNRFDPEEGTAVRFPLRELGTWKRDLDPIEGGREGRTVAGIVSLRDGSLVLSTDAGLARFTPWDGAVHAISPPDPMLEGAQTPEICALEGGGGLVGFGDGSVWRFGSGGRMEPAFAVADSVWAMRCPSGRLPGYVATQVGDVFELGAATGDPELLFRIQSTSGPQPRVTEIVRDPMDVLWIATVQGLFRSDADGGVTRVGFGGQERDLPSNEILSLLVDSQDGLWIGTWVGLARINPRSRIIRRIPTGREGAPGVSGTGVVCFADDPNGGIWIGTLEGGVDFLEPGWEGGPLVISRPEAFQAWPEARVYDMKWDHNGNLWVATNRNSVLVLGADEEFARVVPVASRDGFVREDAMVYSLTVDGSGFIWAGTEHVGLVRYDPDLDQFVEYRGPDGEWSWGSRFVWPTLEDPDGRLWVGGYEWGVTAIDSSRGAIRPFPAGPGSLSDGSTFVLFFGSRGSLWIGTADGGLNRLDPDTGEVRVFTKENGLPHDRVVGLVEDTEGFLWISTNDGLARYDEDRDEFWVLKEESGLAGDHFRVNAAHRTPAGILFFGGPDGVTIIDPAQVRPSLAAPRIELTGVQIHGEEVTLSRALGEAGLDLQPEDNFFAFQFAALDFTDPAQNRYQYMLDGLDEDWIEVGPGHVANYTAVRPGRYTFQVKARNADGVWNERPFEVDVRVRAPYYQTWWFLSVSALAVIALATGVTYGRITEHRRLMDLAARLHDGIGANIASIIRASERIDPDAAVGSRRFAELDRVKSLARRAQTEMRAAVRILRKGKEGESLEDLFQELRDTVDWMLHDHVRYRVAATEEVPRRTVDWRVRTDVCLLMNEALNNVLKHAEASFVDIEMRYDPPHLYLRVTDDGKGFDQSRGSEGSGLGLMRDHSTRHGGENPVRSEPGKGTTVEARLRIH